MTGKMACEFGIYYPILGVFFAYFSRLNAMPATSYINGDTTYQLGIQSPRISLIRQTAAK